MRCLPPPRELARRYRTLSSASPIMYFGTSPPSMSTRHPSGTAKSLTEEHSDCLPQNGLVVTSINLNGRQSGQRLARNSKSQWRRRASGRQR
mmetsp:Transcript_108236/g.345685  ORF Transcript_108236/g.345685 Transcript_108236/m.345685 type:complete len:92 (+) Transcript_108236:72-347(+)